MLSSFGFTICSLSNKSTQTISSGSQITFNTESVERGAKQELTSTEYKNCIETEFQICKNACGNSGDISEITFAEYNELMRWLNREQFHKFKFVNPDMANIFFEASFNISKIEINGSLYVLELSMKTNRPFGLMEAKTYEFNVDAEGTFSIDDVSNREGYIYPHTEIIASQDGEIQISNSLEDNVVYFRNCKAGETITLDYPIVKSSLSSHAIQNDFNWNFLRIANTFASRKNVFTSKTACKIKIQYNPVIKVMI